MGEFDLAVQFDEQALQVIRRERPLAGEIVVERLRVTFDSTSHRRGADLAAGHLFFDLFA